MNPVHIAAVETRLGTSVICQRCNATLETYANSCTADLADPCPGFIAIEQAKTAANPDADPDALTGCAQAVPSE